MLDKISVIVLIYRVEKYLEKCLRSIVQQTYKNLEIILVDDGSDDNCAAICDEYERTDKRVKVIHKENGGIDSARKAGIMLATGKYVTYVDGDDWIEPEMYEKMMSYVYDYGVEIVESGVIDSCGDKESNRAPYIDEGCYKGKKFDEVVGPHLLYAGRFFRHGISPYVVSKIFLKERLMPYQMLPEPSNNIVDDTMCTFPCVCASRALYVTHECFYHYRVRMDSAKREIRDDIAFTVKKCYKDWNGRFDSAIESDNMKGQIDYFTMYLLIAKAIHVFDDAKAESYLTPYGKILRNDRIVLYGAGMVGIHIYHYIKQCKKNNLIYWADKNYKQLEKNEIGCPEGILQYDYDYVIISILSEQAVNSAIEELVSMGIPIEKIKWIQPKYIENPQLLLKKARYNNTAMFEIKG